MHKPQAEQVVNTSTQLQIIDIDERLSDMSTFKKAFALWNTDFELGSIYRRKHAWFYTTW